MSQRGASELIVNPDGSIFHLHLRPDQLADYVLLVGDPGRVQLIASFFDDIECHTANREFHSITGRYRGIRMTALSTGIGTDNIDIVVNELDALVNIDLTHRRELPEKRSLKLIRIGTAGSIQPDIHSGQWMGSAFSLGLDGLLHYYRDFDGLRNKDLFNRIMEDLAWPGELPLPYLAECSQVLNTIWTDEVGTGINVSAHGFYAPQGRAIRLSPTIHDLNLRFSRFQYNQLKITHFEMESSALYGLSTLLGHEAFTLCLILANRTEKKFLGDYHSEMKKMIGYVLDRVSIFDRSHGHK